MEVHRKQNWGQENPKDQIRVILASIHGWMHNLEDGTSKPERVAEQVKQNLDRIQEVLDQYPDLAWDTPPFTPEKK